MPTYEYACRGCGRHLEVVQSFTDDSLEVCEQCGGQLRKVFSAAGIIFKGSGYYVTDTRSEQKRATKTASSSDDSGSDGGGGDSGGGDSGGSDSGGGDGGTSGGASSTGSPTSDGSTSSSRSTSPTDAKSA